MESPESLNQKSMRERLELVVKEGSQAKVILLLREIKRTLETRQVFLNLNKGIINYLYAVGALAYACREISAERAERLLVSLKIAPASQMLEALRSMNYRNYNIYLNIIYMLAAVGMEQTIENVSKMMYAMGFIPDPEIAGFTIEYYKEFSCGKVGYDLPEPQGDVSVVFNKMADMVFSLSAITSGFVVKQIDVLMHDARVANFTEKEVFPYIAAFGLLTFSGKDVERRSMENIVGAMGITPNAAMLDSMMGMPLKNHIMYIIALYFIRALGTDPSLDRVMAVVKALDVIPDAKLAGYVISFYKIDWDSG